MSGPAILPIRRKSLNCKDLNSKFRAVGLWGVSVSEALHGMGIAAGILLPVVVLIVIVSMQAVKRGEAGMRGEAHGASHELIPAYVPAVPETTTAAATKPTKAATVTKTEEVSVIEILGLGLLLFVLTVLALLGVSILRHL